MYFKPSGNVLTNHFGDNGHLGRDLLVADGGKSEFARIQVPGAFDIKFKRLSDPINLGFRIPTWKFFLKDFSNYSFYSRPIITRAINNVWFFAFWKRLIVKNSNL